MNPTVDMLKKRRLGKSVAPPHPLLSTKTTAESVLNAASEGKGAVQAAEFNLDERR